MTTEDFQRRAESLLNGLLGKIAVGGFMTAALAIGGWQLQTQHLNSIALGDHTRALSDMQRQIDGMSSSMNEHDKTLDQNQRQIKSDLEEQQKNSKSDLEKKNSEVLESIRELARSVAPLKGDLMAIRQSLIDQRPSIVIPFSEDH